MSVAITKTSDAVTGLPPNIPKTSNAFLVPPGGFTRTSDATIFAGVLLTSDASLASRFTFARTSDATALLRPPLTLTSDAFIESEPIPPIPPLPPLPPIPPNPPPARMAPFACNVRSVCSDPASPIQNLSSEAPDVDHFFGYASGPADARPGENWTSTTCQTQFGPIYCLASNQTDADLCVQRLTQLCAQVQPQDGTVTIDCCGTALSQDYPGIATADYLAALVASLIAQCQVRNPTCGLHSWTISLACCGSDVTGLVTSAMSPADITAVMRAMQTQCQAIQPGCLNDPPAGPPDNPIVPGFTLYASHSASCVTHCPDGTPFTFTVPAGIFVSRSQSLADAQAQAYACRLAPLNKVCLSPLPPECCANDHFSELITASSRAAVGFWFTEGALPHGLELVPTAGQLSATLQGTPDIAGSYSFNVVVVDSLGNTMRRSYSLCVIEISATPAGTDSGHLPDATPGTAYTVTLEATPCALPALEWAVTVGALPDGLTLDPGTGVISGTPTKTGTFTFTVQVATQAT